VPGTATASRLIDIMNAPSAARTRTRWLDAAAGAVAAAAAANANVAVTNVQSGGCQPLGLAPSTLSLAIRQP